MMITRTLAAVLAALSIVAAGTPARATILDFRQLVIDLTDAEDARAKATWSEPGDVRLTTDGLGFEHDAAASWDGWIQTVPLAVGTWWRPAGGVSVRVGMSPGTDAIRLPNGQETTPWKGFAYVRYSPDLVHWSSWQAMEDAEGRPGAKLGRSWAASVRVPACEAEEYAAKLAEYQRRDVPWTSDEDAAVRWITKRDPRFFSRHIPFVGYVQVRFEGPFVGGRRFTRLEVEVTSAVSGVSTIPKDPDAMTRRGGDAWSFDARARR